MPYVVTENCICCKYTDCVEVCPVDCFYEGENFLVINPEECIDCGVCEPECPAKAIKSDSDADVEKWIDINRTFSSLWPNISEKQPIHDKATSMDGVPNKLDLYFSEAPGRREL